MGVKPRFHLMTVHALLLDSVRKSRVKAVQERNDFICNLNNLWQDLISIVTSGGTVMISMAFNDRVLDPKSGKLNV